MLGTRPLGSLHSSPVALLPAATARDLVEAVAAHTPWPARAPQRPAHGRSRGAFGPAVPAVCAPAGHSTGPPHRPAGRGRGGSIIEFDYIMGPDVPGGPPDLGPVPRSRTASLPEGEDRAAG